jgi:hypothetical protein
VAPGNNIKISQLGRCLELGHWHIRRRVPTRRATNLSDTLRKPIPSRIGGRAQVATHPFRGYELLLE